MLTPSPVIAKPASEQDLAESVGEAPVASTESELDAGSQDVQASLRKRFLSPHTLISFAFALLIIWFVFRRLEIDPGAIWAQIRTANPLLLGVAFVLWYGAFFVRGWRWGYMLQSAGVTQGEGRRLPPTPVLAEIILLAYFANSLVPAKLGDAYRAYLLKREAGVPLSSGFGTILAERLVDAMMLVFVLGGSALIVFGRRLPPEATPALMLGAVLLGVGAIGLAVMWLTRDTIARLLPGRFQETYTRLQGAVFGSLSRPVVVFGIGLLLWFGDGMRVWFVANSLGAGISPSVAILVAVMGALLTIIPFTPAGLGVVELGVGSVLVGVLGVDPVVAGSIIVLDRVVAYWSLLLVGAVLYLRRTRRELQQPASDAVTAA